MSDDEENPVLAAMATMAVHGITLDAARADSEAVHSGGGQFDRHAQLPTDQVPLSGAQRHQVDQTSAELVRSLSPELQVLLARVRSGEVSTATFETQFRQTYEDRDGTDDATGGAVTSG